MYVRHLRNGRASATDGVHTFVLSLHRRADTASPVNIHPHNDYSQFSVQMKNQLEDVGFIVLPSVFSAETPGIQCLKDFASRVDQDHQQVCLDLEEIGEHSTQPHVVFSETRVFRDFLIQTIEDQLCCRIERWSENVWASLNYIRRKQLMGSFTPTHRDANFLKNDRDGLIDEDTDIRKFYTAWIPLMDLTEAHSHLQVLPRSHLTRSRQIENSDRKRRKLSTVWTSLILPKLSLVIFNSKLQHRASSHRIPSDPRISIDFRFKIMF